MIKIYKHNEISTEQILERSEQTIDVEGIVTDNGFTSLYGETEIRENQIAINGEVCYNICVSICSRAGVNFPC